MDFDFSKAFETVYHDILLREGENRVIRLVYGERTILSTQNYQWFAIILEGHFSKGLAEACFFLFNHLTKDSHDGIENPPTKSVGNRKLVESTLDEKLTGSNDPDQVEKWFEINRMKFNTDCKVDVGRKNAQTQNVQ